MKFRNWFTAVALLAIQFSLNGCETYTPKNTAIEGVSQRNNEIRVTLPSSLPLEKTRTGEKILELRRRNGKPLKLKGISKREGATVVFESIDKIENDAINSVTQLYLYEASNICTLPSGFFTHACDLALCVGTVHCIPGDPDSADTCSCI